MKILYDSNIFLNYKVGGISRYHYELLKGVKSSNSHEVKMAGRFVKNKYLWSDKELKKDFVYDPFAIFTKLNRRIVKKTIKGADYDLIHPTDFVYFDMEDIPKDKKVVFTIHDMIYEKQLQKHILQKLDFARRADKLIAVSQATKNDIVKIYGIEPEKISVIYHGSSLNLNQAAAVNHIPRKIPENFMLYVGNRDGYKNFNGFVAGVAPLIRKNGDLYLVCVGKNNFSESEVLLLKNLGVFSKTLCYSKISDNQLAYFYSKSKAFIFPSLMEGFGIPILEAWACRTPVILSSTTCFHEIAAEGGLYFDPCDSDSIYESVSKVLSDKSLRNELIKIGEKRLNSFSWKNTVEQTIKLYESIQ
jgi:glycosyltransferase involved in cell wall biosynthesis